jgi:hypothetical protein
VADLVGFLLLVVFAAWVDRPAAPTDSGTRRARVR